MDRQRVQQILGFSELPDESGTWGMLLPGIGERQVGAEPDALDIVQELTPAVLAFRSAEADASRGWIFGLGLWVATFAACATASVAVTPWHPTTTWTLASIAVGAQVLVFGLALFAAARAWRAPLAPPIVISRRLRRIYAWADKKTGWRVFDYDRLVPATFFGRVVTGAGAGTVYMLRLCELEPGTRRITGSVGPVPPRGNPQACGAAWEFIRRYMDGPPEALPAVKWQPPIGDLSTAWFQIDRDMFVDHIDASHRLRPSLFSWVFVWFWSVIDHWQRIAAIWIQRTAPRPAYPAELVEAMRFDGANPYKRIEPTGDEALALHARLPHMRLRWNAVRVLATLLWGGLLVAMVAGAVTTR